MSTNTKRLEASVEGRVQGVGFRHFTRTTARRLGLQGWVRNESDGSVTVIAEGDRDSLDELAEAIQDGPRSAVVESADISWHDAENDFSGFSVKL